MTLRDVVSPNWFRGFKRHWTGPRLKVHNPQEPAEDGLESRADEILEKLHRHGEASLSARERRILEEYSRKMKQKHH